MDAEPQRRPRLLTGNEAVALAAIEAGVEFFAGYPITPSTEIAETLATRLPKQGRVFLQMEDEIAAISAIIGGALAGAKTMTATSGPGFSLKQEGIGYACEAEVPCVIVNVMRGGPSTGMPTLPSQGDVMQAKWGTHGDHPAVALSPERVIEAYEMTMLAFDLAEKLRTPVVLLLDEIVGHVTEKVVLPLENTPEVASNRKTDLSPEEYRPYGYAGRLPPPLVPFGTGYRYHVTGLIHDETGFPTNEPAKAAPVMEWLVNKVEKNQDLMPQPELLNADGAEILLVAYGAVARSAKGAMRLAREAGLNVGMFRLRTIWPFPTDQLIAAARGSKKVIVPEMNMGQIAHEVEWALQGSSQVHSFPKVGGDPISPDEIFEFLKGVAK